MYPPQILVPKGRSGHSNTYMAAFIDSHETERAALLDLAVNDAIRRRDIGVAAAVEAWLSYLDADHFTA